MKKILILGANGTIGHYLVDYFSVHNMEHDIKILSGDLKCSKFLSLHSEFHRIDVRDKNTFSSLPNDIYAIIDLATVMPARMDGFSASKYVETNVLGTTNVLDYCRENQVDRLLFAQTFGDILAYAEENPILSNAMSPKTDYKDSKSIYITTMDTAVELIKCYHTLFGQKAFLFRLPTIYSWNFIRYYENGKETREGYHLLMEQASKGEDIHVWGDPYRKKDMVYVKDLAQMFYKATFVDRDYGFYNVGTGIGTTLLDQIKGYVEVFGGGKKSRILFSPEKRNAPQYIMDITSAVNDLGYKPKYDFISMLKDIKREAELDRFGFKEQYNNSKV